MGRSENSSSSSSSKRRRLTGGSRKRHLYLAIDDWDGGYSIHKLDADSILLDQESAARGEEDKLPEPAAVRIASPVRGPMAFAALGTNIFVATNPRCRRRDRAPPTFVFDTETSALTLGPRVPDKLHDLGAAMAVGGETLYAVTTARYSGFPSLQVMSLASTSVLDRDPWDPPMEWSWSDMPASPPPLNGADMVAYALHPDGRTIFVSTRLSTHCLDTSNAAWKELGDWVLPFRGRAYFDGDLDAWVGLHHRDDGYVCCCPVASRSAAARQPPECRMLGDVVPHYWSTSAYRISPWIRR